MKDKVVLVLSQEAVMSLIGDDPELEVRLKQCAVSALMKQATKASADDVTEEVMAMVRRHEKEASKRFESIVMSKFKKVEKNNSSSWYRKRFMLEMLPEAKEELEKVVAELFTKLSTKTLYAKATEVEAWIKHAETVMKKKLDEFDKKIKAWIEAKLDDEALDKVADMVVEKMAGKLR